MPTAHPHPVRDLSGWSPAEAEALLRGLQRHVQPHIITRPAQAHWLDRLPLADLGLTGEAAQRAVEANFTAWRIDTPGLLTAYYEPVIQAARTPEGAYRTPLYKRPADLVRVPARPDLPGDGTWGRALSDGSVVPYPDRRAIRAGTLDATLEPLAYVADPVDAFFAQIQGSARLALTDGAAMRIGYHGKTGHPYTAIGRVLIDRGWLPEGGATMATIRAVLAAHPEIVDDILAENRSYVFFRERPLGDPALGPTAAGGVPLVPLRSLAVDRAEIAHGTPVHIAASLTGLGDVRRVTIAEDAGSAIVGQARGDLFIGTGEAAGAIAGDVKAEATFTLVLPNGVSP